MPPKTTELRICTRTGVHTCRMGSIHLHEREKAILEEYITTLRKEIEEAYQQGKEDAFASAAKIVTELL